MSNDRGFTPGAAPYQNERLSLPPATTPHVMPQTLTFSSIAPETLAWYYQMPQGQSSINQGAMIPTPTPNTLRFDIVSPAPVTSGANPAASGSSAVNASNVQAGEEELARRAEQERAKHKHILEREEEEWGLGGESFEG